MAWQTPITDWISTDIYNPVTDLTRNMENIEYLETYLETFLDPITLETMDKPADYTGKITITQLNDMEDNAETLKDALPSTPPGWTTPVTDWENRDTINYTTVNRWEGNTAALKSMADNMLFIMPKCGLAACGKPAIIAAMGVT